MATPPTNASGFVIGQDDECKESSSLYDGTFAASHSLPSGPDNDSVSQLQSHTTGGASEQRSAIAPRRRYSIQQLIQTLGSNVGHHTDLPPELERRVLDFRLARQKRKEKYGVAKQWGIFGMYPYLVAVRVDLEWAEDAAWRRQNSQPYLAWADFDTARLRATRPWFTYAIVSLCTIMLLVEFIVNGFRFESLSTNLMIGPSKETLIKVWARDTERIVVNGEWQRIFAPILLHAGVIHYAINMIVFWFLGSAVEEAHGSWNCALLFLVPGIGGNLLSAIFLPQFVSVGASGGIFGLMGACFTDIGLNWSLLFLKTGDEEERGHWRRNGIAVTLLILETVINAVFGLITPFVDNWSHLGGLLYGACCALSILEPLDVGFFGVNETYWGKIRAIVVKFFGILISLFLIMATSIWLATSEPGANPCSGCRYISCVPFPFFREQKWWYCDDCDFATGNLYRTGSVYSMVEINCPDESVVTVDISDDNIMDPADARRMLPSFCQDHCTTRFMN